MKKLALVIALVFFAQNASADEADLTTGLQALGARDFSVAVANLQPLANDGNVEAAYRMCGMYYLGDGVPKNDAEAARYCHIAAEKGHVDAMYNLGLMYNKGEGVGQDFNEAAKWYAAAAAKGHPDARFNLKQLQIANTPGTNTKALELVHNAATNITPAKRQAVATASESFPPAPAAAPTPPAPVQATPTPAPQIAAAPVKPTQKSVKKQVVATPPIAPPVPPVPPKPPVLENSTTPLMLSQMNKEPELEAPEQPTKTQAEMDLARYCLMAAQRGNPDPGCAKDLAPKSTAKQPDPAPVIEKPTMPVAPKPPEEIVIPKKQLIKQDPAPEPKKPEKVFEGSELYKTLGTPDKKDMNIAIVSMATSSLTLNSPSLPIFEPPKPFEIKPIDSAPHSLNWYIGQANTGNAQAQNNLGVMYRRGNNGAPKDTREAIKYFERAASQGSVNGMLNLASIYKIGEGTDQNLELAYAWYNLATDRLPRGSEKRDKAQANVKEIAKYLTNEQIGDALQYVTELDENLPVMNEPLTAEDEEPK